ncbi:Uncharacterised protein [Klebsiella variicola]|uniref:hypothetical protein n=1 Tax=Klebsiella TaxID=570 RepID=UPI000E2D47BA|nr:MULTISPECIES: hypothetical protein [Klebsiella]NIG26575.1 emp24/gp25L/p24 family protein [Klebsiella sp. Acro-834]NIG40931.1 emp24/gp25L/p24 family protein [Klebsiella sp. Acro-833]SXE51725.1 Uncharacterised protein [Klebsiella variicola]SXE60625.1 Uncharacterised protein [Klebsiella variicola]HCB9205888.1 hypothetical protein [Klebsiella variicola]
MIDPSSPLSEKKVELERLVLLARKKVEQAKSIDFDDKTSKEQQMMEGARGADEKAYDDLKTTVESLTIAVEKIDTRSGELRNDHLEQLLEMRETYAKKAYRFVWLWSITLIVILILQGSTAPVVKFWFFEMRAANFNLDSKVLIALITGVTVNIVAVFIVVMRNLFPSDSKEKSTQEEKK